MEKAKRKELEFQARRAVILKEAERAFAQKGFYNTSVAEIANASGFAIGTLYQIFNGKEHLYSTMVTQKLQGLYTDIRSAVSREAETVHKLEALVRSNFLFVENNLDFCRLFTHGGEVSYQESGESLKEILCDFHLEHVNFIEGIIKKGIEEKTLRRESDSRDMAGALMGMMKSFQFRWIMSNGEESLVGKVPVVMDIFLRGAGNDV